MIKIRNWVKWQISFLVVVIGFICLSSAAWAKEEVSIELRQGGEVKNVTVSGISGSVTYLPVRVMADLSGITIEWDPNLGAAVYYTNGQNTVVAPGINKVYVVNNEIATHKIVKETISREGRLYVPLRVLELAGMVVHYDAGRNQRILYVPENINKDLTRLSAENITAIKGLIKKERDSVPQKVGSYTTSFNSGLKSRTKNLKLAANAINGYEMGTGGIFSFNKVVGPRTPSRGYEKAIIYVNKEMVEDYGGGICQVSTTLYNAVLNSKLPVVERHIHSLPVPYVPLGKDATVSYGSKDFKFKNNQKRTLVIQTRVDGNKLTTEIYLKPL